jgi:hypothetical protein
MRTMGDEQGEEKRTRTAFPKKKKNLLQQCIKQVCNVNQREHIEMHLKTKVE